METKELKKQWRGGQYNQIIAFINELCDEQEISATIISLKENRVFIDTTGRNCYRRIIKKIVNQSILIKNYIYELNIVNLLFVQDKKVQNYLKRKISANKRLAVLWKTFGEAYGMNVDRLKNDETFDVENVDPIINFNGNVEILNDAFKSLMYDDEITKDGRFKYKPFKFFIDKFDMAYCRLYIHYSIWADVWDQKYHDWLQNRVSLQKEGKLIKMHYINKESLDWFLKSRSKMEIYDDINELHLASIAESSPLGFIEGEKNFDYALACGFVEDSFHTDNLNEMAGDVALKYWIQAYESLVRYSQKHLQRIEKEDAGFLRIFDYENYFYREKGYWLSIFEDANIPAEEAEKLFSLMVYNKKSTDLYDYPFIAVKNKYLLPYFLLKDASVGLILRSRLRKADMKMEKKGKFFENRIIKLLKDKKIPVVQLKRRDKFHGNDKKEDYECDVAFILEDILFLCECKDNGRTAVSEKIENFYESDVKQLNRYCDYFEANKEYVIEIFNKNGYSVKKIGKVIRLLIYNTYFHKPINYRGVKIIDFERIAAPIRRGILDMEICRRYKGPIRCLQGNFTAKKLLDYFESNYIVCGYDKITRHLMQTLELGKYKLEVETEIHAQIDRIEMMKLVSPVLRAAEELGIHKKNRDIFEMLFS